VPIRAVVFDIGGVLERVDDHSWPTTWAQDWAGRAGMTLDELDAALAARPPIGDLLTGGATEAEFRDLYAGALGLDELRADLMMAQMWDAYCGELDRELFEWFTSLRGDYLLGILGVAPDEVAFLDDSAPAVSGAREAGWHAVLHTDTRASIGELERLLAKGC
jgi:putative hydrolase of the HAD superfamily